MEIYHKQLFLFAYIWHGSIKPFLHLRFVVVVVVFPVLFLFVCFILSLSAGTKEARKGLKAYRLTVYP